MAGAPEELTGGIVLHCGDCLDVLKTLDENSIDACVTDPPYHLTNRTPDVKWCADCNRVLGGSDGKPSSCPKCGGRLEFQRSQGGRGFMGKQWDGGDVAFQVDTWKRVLRVLKPGAYIVAFSSSRTYHRMACAIEDAGFITHPLVAWITGQGFPKAHSVSEHIDRMAGVEREVVDIGITRAGGMRGGAYIGGDNEPETRTRTAPATDAACELDGWYYGTQSLKPAIEPIYVGQKPFEKGLNGTQNILKWGTGALNIDGCRVGIDEDERCVIDARSGSDDGIREGIYHDGVGARARGDKFKSHSLGRWPANVIHDGSDEVVGAFPDVHGAGSACESKWARSENVNVYGKANDGMTGARRGESGSAARFFYSAKADSDDRLGSSHPTVKPLDLMQYLCRLVGRKGCIILDPFAGTGTTGEAALREGIRAVLIEREEEYQVDIRRRMRLAMSGPDERAREAIKAKTKDKPVDHGPLFGEVAP